MDKTKKKFNRWFITAIIGMAGGVSFELAYMKYTYQPQMESFMHLSATQVGVMLSVYAVFAMIFYAPSGVIADKFNHRYLITGGLVITGLMGFAMAAYPPYWIMIAINIVWAVTTVLFMWSATVKAISVLGNADEQGSLLGFSEGMRGVGCMLAAFLTLWLFKVFGGEHNPNSFRAVLITYGIIMLLFAVLCWFMLPDGNGNAQESIQVEKAPKGQALKNVLYVLKRPVTWYCSFIVFGVFIIYTILSYTASYLMDMFGMGMTLATFVSIMRNQVIRSVSAPTVGLLTAKTRIKSPTIWLILGLAVMIPGLLLLIFVPATPKVLFFMIALMMLLAFCMYAGRGLYFATVGEVHTPKEITGTTIGIMSVIGFTPDVFVYPIVGHWQDTLPAAMAYRNMWYLGLGGVVIGLVSCFLLYREIQKVRHKIPAMELAGNAVK